MTTAQYQEQFNKQLAQQLDQVRKQQPNHIPVYSMKYKNASKYLVEDLKQSLALFPKKFKLKSVYEIIQKQSLAYCKQKLIKTDSKVIKDGDNFKIPAFHLYTIQMIKKNQQQQNQKESNTRQKPRGKFVKLDLQMTFQQAFDKYGRQNVLTLVYTDAEQIRYQYTQSQRIVQKWVKRLLIFIVILIIIPYLMKDSQSKGQFQGIVQRIQQTDFQRTQQTDQQNTLDIGGKRYVVQLITNNQDDMLYDRLVIENIGEVQNFKMIKKQREVEYDDETM